MKAKSIAIIGGGNLGAAIAEGLIKSKFVTAQQLTVTRRNTDSLFPLKAQGVNITSDNKAAIEKSEVIIVALKPYTLRRYLKN